MKDILVVTPTLGNRPTLKNTVDAVRTIGADRIHHIIVAPAAKFDAVRAIVGNDIQLEPEPDGCHGIYPALNHVFNKFGHDYKYLTFINDDDYWLPSFSKLIAAADGNLDFVYGKVCYGIDDDTLSMACSSRFRDFIPLLFSNIILFTQQSTLLKSELFFQIGGFDESFKLAADSLFWARLSKLPLRYKYVPLPCAMYTIQAGQLSSDGDTSKKEHARLFSMLDRPSRFRIAIAKFLFRLANAGVYLKRLFSKKKHHVSDYMTRTNHPPLVNFLVALLPWFLKRRILNHFYGYDLHPLSRIGFSYIFPHFLRMASGARIGNFNVAVNLDSMTMGENSTIARGNWITGFPTGTTSKHFAHDKNRRSQLIMGRESAITKNHHIDCTNAITIGDFVTIAGYQSQLLTHSIDVYQGRQDSLPISIGDYCFVSTGVTILGGTALPAHSLLSAGAVLTKQYEEEWKIYAGVPAKPIKGIPPSAAYFTRDKGFVI